MKNGNAKSKLAEVLERRQRDKAAAIVEQQARDLAAQAKEARREAVRQQWLVAKQAISAAVEAINAEIDGTGMVLSWSEKPRQEDHPGLAQLFITLAEDGVALERRVVLNVSALGHVQLVTLIPHTGPKIPDFNIEMVEKDFYEGIIVDFIDLCISKGAQS